MDAYELAGMLFSHKRAESDASERLRDLTISGVAESDSADGLVSISLDGDLTQAEDDGLEHDHTILIPTEVGVYAGDEVAVTLTGADLSTLRVTGVVGDGDRVNARISGIEADYVKATELEADIAEIGYLKADSAVITDIQADTAKVHNLTAQEISAATGYVADLEAGNVSAQDIVAGKATVGELVADHVSVSDFQAEQANIDSLQAATADIATIRANSAKVQNLTAAQLEADHATIGTLDTTYMHADMANADVAWIQNGTIKDGAIVSAMINDVSANKLTAGTINGSVINVTNLNADNITTGTINGQRIGEGSLSLDKLSDDVYTEAEVNTIVDGLNDRIDGAIETFTGTAVPTLNNSPASSWNTTKLKDEHVGDVYYVVNSQSQQNGYCYRFTKSGSTYSWQLIKDSDVTAALSRLTTAEGKITTFDSDISTLKTDTGELKTKTQSLETSLGDKVDTTTFNELSSTVDENSSSITSMSTVLSNNGLTSSTNITNTVNTVSQTATGNSSKISQLTTTLGTNADGTTKAGDVMHRTSAIEQDVSSFKTTVSETYATQTALATTNGNVTAAQTAADNAQATANTANNKQVAFSATSSTGATTAAKVASCTNFPTLTAGVTVTVRFSTANTSTGAVTLNVNSTGAKTVYVNGAATSSSNQLLWGANANITFTYDGSYWRVNSEPRTWYGTGAVAAATAAKTATINEVVICKGTTVVLNMTYENTSTSATLNVTSTGAKNIYYGTTTTRPTTANGYGWGAGSTVSLTFDGQYWRIGDTTALTRLTAAESTISSHTTSISQNASAIALKADSSTTYTKTDVDGLISTEVTNRNAAITAKANEITSSVSETYATKSSVNGKADASDVTALAGRVTTAESNITQNANNIALKVSESDVTGNYLVGKINLDSTTASIAAQRINLQGAVTISDLASDASTSLTNAAKTATSYVTDITGGGIMVHPSTDQTTGVRVTSDVDILRDGTSVINVGENDAIRIGANDNVQMLLESNGLEIDNEVGDQIFGIESSSSGSTTVTATLVTWSTTASVDTTARTVSDSTTAAGEPIVTATVNGTDYTLESTHVTTTVTAGTGVTVALTSSGVSYVQDLMVIEVDDDGVETIAPCELSVEYQRAVTDVATLDFSGKQVIHGSGVGVLFTNDEWADDNKVDTYFESRNEATGTAIYFGVGASGQNRGIWDPVAWSWLIYRTESNDTVINGPKFGVAASGNVKSTYQVRVTGNGTTAETQKRIALRSNNVANRGLFDESLNKWILYRSLAGNDHLAGGKWYVDDPYNTSTNFKLGDPQRLMSGGSYSAGTSDTMGPYVTVTAGKWLVTGNWIFANTSSSSKRLVVGFYRSTTGQAYTYRVHTTASSSSAHRLEVVDTITIDAASERLTLYASSSPASTSAATQYIVAIRLT